MDARPAVVVAGIAVAAWLQGFAAESNEERRRNDFRYTPDPRVIRVAAGAHRSTTADLIWLRTLPDMSKEFRDVAAKARWIGGAMGVITDLEPSFFTVYDFGQAYLANLGRTTPGALDEAVALLEKGIAQNPGSDGLAGLHVRLAMLHYIERKDREAALRHLEKASLLPGFDSLSASMLTAMRAAKREDVVAIGYWADLLGHGTPEMKQRAERELYATKAEIMRRAAREFEKTRGRKPAAPADLCVPELVQAEVIPVLLEGLEIGADGVPRYPRGTELHFDDIARGAERWARVFRDDVGRWPTLADFAARDGALPAPPAGRVWHVEDGRVTLVPAEGAGPR